MAPYDLGGMTAGDAANGSVKWRWAVLALGPWAALVAVGTADPWLSRIPGTELDFVRAPDTSDPGGRRWGYNASSSDVLPTEASPTSALARACGTGLDSTIHWIPFGDRAVGWCRAQIVLLAGPPVGELSDEQVLGAFTPRPSVRTWAAHPVAVREITPGELLIAWISGRGDVGEGVARHRVHVGLYDERLKPLGPVQTFVAPHTVGAVFVGARLGLTQVDAAHTTGRMRYDEDLSAPRLSFLLDARDGTVRRVGRLQLLRQPTAIGASLVTLACLLLSLGMVLRRHALVRALRGQTARIISAADTHGGPDGTVSMTTAVGVLRFRRRRARLIGFAKGHPTDGPCTVVLAGPLPALGGAPFRDHPVELAAKERPVVVRGDGVVAVREAEQLRRLAIRNAAIGIGAAALPLLLATF